MPSSRRRRRLEQATRQAATYDPDGGRALLVRWKVPEARVVFKPYVQMGGTRAIVARLPGKQPAALAWDGGSAVDLCGARPESAC